MLIQKIDVNKLNPAPYNPRKDLRPGDPEYEKLKRSIQEFGCVQTIVWNQRTGNVVGGHQTLKVLKDLGITETEVSVVDLDDAGEKTLNVALNKIQGAWDSVKLAELLGELSEEGFADLAGFSDKEIEKFAQAADEAIKEAGEIPLEDFEEESFSHKCPRCGFLF